MGLAFNTFVLILLLFLSIQCGVSSSLEHRNPKNLSDFYSGDHEYGYVEVRKGAFMFWWLYYAGGDKETAYEKPLIIWIQGGPGIPASGVGNFLEMGPQDINLQTRNSSWVHKRNVLFIDSPVGTGFSYVTNESLHAKTIDTVAFDLVELTKQFLNKLPKFQAVPTHIFSQSYGGKIAPRLAYYLHKKIQSKDINMNLKTVGLGSAYVSPKHYTLAYPDSLFNLGFIDQYERILLKNKTNEFAIACNEHNDEEAFRLQISLVYFMKTQLNSSNKYNIIKKGDTAYGIDPAKDLEPFMNDYVKKIISDAVPADTITWTFANINIQWFLQSELMKPSMNFVEKLLNETDIKIAVYNGQLDIITSIPGALRWVHRLKWCGADKFKNAKRQIIPGEGNGYCKSYGRLSFWWIHRAGHSIPSDNPEAMEQILIAATSEDDTSSECQQTHCNI